MAPALPSKIRFTPGISADVRGAIEPHLLAWEHIIPAWCHEVNVTWCDDRSDGALSIVTHYEYRRADIAVYANFLSCPDRRERNVVHELLHIVTAPMRNTAFDLKNAVAKDRPEMLAWAEEMIRHSDESVTCDLTALVMALQPTR